MSAHVTVCVATYGRPRLLPRLLGALLDRIHELPDDISADILVVDNNAKPTAETAVRELPPHGRDRVRLVHEPRPGIPFARNRALDEVNGTTDFVAFIDDDERPLEGWLVELVRAARTYDADAVAGPVIPEFEEAPPRWLRDNDIYWRPRYETGTRLTEARTGNLLVAISSLESMGRLFDERLAATGGSDTELFRRFHRQGNEIVWCDEACVIEFVPQGRTTTRWFLQRSFRIGSNRVERLVIRDGGVVSVLLLAGGAAGEFLVGVLLAATGILSRKNLARGISRVVRAIGTCAALLGHRYAEYSRPTRGGGSLRA